MYSKTSKFRGLLTAAAIVACGSAQAFPVEFDFVDLADRFYNANNYEATWDQAVAWDELDTDGFWSGDAANDGLHPQVRAFMEAANGQPVRGSAHAFLDSSAGKANNEAGLGLCSTGSDDNGPGLADDRSLCATGYNGDDVDTGDDNVKDPEIVGLEFDDVVRVTIGLFRDKSHNATDGTVEIAYGIDLLNPTDMDFTTCDLSLGVLGACDAAGPVVGNYFYFRPGNQEGYLSAVTVGQVPLPAAGLLLMAGLGGLAAVRRRG